MSNHLKTSQQGFTLLEVMIVITIIATLVGMVNLSSSSDPFEDQLKEFSSDFLIQFEVFQQESVFQNVDLGLGLESDQYTLLKYTDRTDPFVIQEIKAQLDSLEEKVTNGEMTKKEADEYRQKIASLPDNSFIFPYEGNIKSEYEIPEYIEFEVLIEDKKVPLDEFFDSESGLKPVIVISSSDEYSPFKLRILHKEANYLQSEIVGDGLNPLLYEISKEEAF